MTSLSVSRFRTNEAVRTTLTRPKEVCALLARLKHRPSKRLGQHYLINAHILEWIVHTADIQENEPILEIGPGLGALTERILLRTGNVTCIEKDRTMAAYLRSRFPDITLIERDALEIDMDSLFHGGITGVASNPPYSAASRLITRMAACTKRPRRMTLTIQQEVAERLTAKTGHKTYGVLSILVGAFYDIILVRRIAPSCFLPPPRVGSALIRMERRRIPAIESGEYEQFRRLVKGCFSYRRKQMGTILRKIGLSSDGGVLAEAGIERSERPERIEIERWVRLTRLLNP